MTQSQAQKSVDLAAPRGQQRQASTPHDRTRTAPKPKQAKRARTDFKANRNASATKSGPGRFHVGGKPGTRIGKPREIRSYIALGAAWAAKRITKAALRDEHGAYTLIGRDTRGYEYVEGTAVAESGYPRRKWLAGISAQRGY